MEPEPPITSEAAATLALEVIAASLAAAAAAASLLLLLPALLLLLARRKMAASAVSGLGGNDWDCTGRTPASVGSCALDDGSCAAGACGDIARRIGDGEFPRSPGAEARSCCSPEAARADVGALANFCRAFCTEQCQRLGAKRDRGAQARKHEDIHRAVP